jgi:hypothetical protein
MKHLVLNFFGGPSAGKTTTASRMFTLLKESHIDAELVGEFAKDCILQGNLSAIKNQIHLFGHQHHRQLCAYQNSQVAVCDSPLLLCAIYNAGTSEHLTNLTIEQHHRFNNINVFVRRQPNIPYSMSGRIHSLDESIIIDQQILDLLTAYKIPFMYYDALGEDDLLQCIISVLNES